MATEREELHQYYGIQLAQKALWSPASVLAIAIHALRHLDDEDLAAELALIANQLAPQQEVKDNAL